MRKMKEISADQVLSLLSISLGSDALISFKDIDKFFDLLKEINDKNNKNCSYYFGINMPMNSNFDETLFEEINSGENQGKLRLIKIESPKTSEIIKEKMTKHIISLAGKDIEFMNSIKLAIKLYSEEYNKNKLCIIDLQKNDKNPMLEKIKSLVKTK